MAEISAGDIILKKFRILSAIAEGGMGRVYLAEDIESDVRYAVKETDANDFNRKEAEVLEVLDHPSLPKLYAKGEIDGKFYIVMDYISGHTLEELIRGGITFDEECMTAWYMQLVDILRYLHGINPPVAYRDLKPSNIIISDDNSVKLIDFGIAKEYSPEHVNSRKITALTRGYAAPEQYTLTFDVDVRTDIYALGATMHYLFTGKNPQRPPYRFAPVRKLNPSASRAIGYIIQKSLQPVPEKRYQSAEELFLDLYNKEALEQKLKKNERSRRIFACLAGLVLILTAVVVFISVGSYQKSRQGSYAEQIESAAAALEKKNYDEAEEILEKAIEEEPDIETAYIKMAEVYCLRGDTDLASQYLELYVEPKFPEVVTYEEYIKLKELLDTGGSLEGSN